MTIPFLDFFKKKVSKGQPVAVIDAPFVPLEKPASERFSKTVMPNASRTPGPDDPFQDIDLSPGSGFSEPASRPSISFNGPTNDLPRAVALALEPKVERAISLDLADVVSHMPEGMVRALEGADATRRVLLKASELERGMATGKPSVSIATIYQQVPEIFLKTIAPTDNAQVRLPFEKVMEGFSALHVRDDQNREQTVPQVVTPFLQVTLEDNEKFGIKTEEFQMVSDLPPVRVEPATAEALAAAEPEPAAPEKAVLPAGPRPIKFPVSTDPASNGNSPGAGSVASPSRIPFKLSPKGTDRPANERVPASGGPSVPTSVPARIPFKLSSPNDAKPAPWAATDTVGDQEPAAASIAAPTGLESTKISLALKPILQSLLPLQLTGDISVVPDDACIEILFSLLEPQLASGRVSLKPGEFAKNLSEKYRGLFNADETLEPVPLPLPEILKKLPTASLRFRADQVEQEKGVDYMTPFSLKAEEDAERMKVAATPVPKPVVPPPPAFDLIPELDPPVVEKPVAAPIKMEPVAVMETAAVEDPVPASALATPEPEPAPVIEKQPEPAITPAAAEVKAAAEVETAPSSGTRSALQTALDTDDELDAKAVVAHVTKMSGVQACAIMFGDGLSLAGNLPEMYEADGLCAMAPSLLQRIDNHMVETKLGALRAMTLSCAQAAVTFFMHDNLCLAALHTKDELASDVRERLARAVHELSVKYSHPA